MVERIVVATWWTLVMGFIAAAGVAAAYIGYWGVCELVAARWRDGTSALVAAIVLAVLTVLACRHRSDLVYG